MRLDGKAWRSIPKECAPRGELIEISKTGGRQRTFCCITPEGRKRFVDYLTVLERVLLDAGAVSETESRLRALQKP